MIFGPSGRVHDARKPLVLTLGPPTYFQHMRTIHIVFRKTYLEKSRNLKIRKVWKRRAPTNPQDPSYQISFKLHGTEILDFNSMKQLKISFSLSITGICSRGTCSAH